MCNTIAGYAVLIVNVVIPAQPLESQNSIAPLRTLVKSTLCVHMYFRLHAPPVTAIPGGISGYTARSLGTTKGNTWPQNERPPHTAKRPRIELAMLETHHATKSICNKTCCDKGISRCCCIRKTSARCWQLVSTNIHIACMLLDFRSGFQMGAFATPNTDPILLLFTSRGARHGKYRGPTFTRSAVSCRKACNLPGSADLLFWLHSVRSDSSHIRGSLARSPMLRPSPVQGMLHLRG